MDDKNVQLKAFPKGPLKISGNFTIVDSRGKEIASDGPVFLCRCGGSENKPYCDGSHHSNGFSG